VQARERPVGSGLGDLTDILHFVPLDNSNP
jgi:hypothetical protein